MDEAALEFEDAVERWVARGESRALSTWARRELDIDGIPRRLPVAAWPSVLQKLASLQSLRRRAWPLVLWKRLHAFAESTAFARRHDGFPVFGTAESAACVSKALRSWNSELGRADRDDFAGRLQEAGFERAPVGAKSLDSWASRRVPVAFLRDSSPNARATAALDQRDGSLPAWFELHAHGSRIVGTTWWSSLVAPAGTTMNVPSTEDGEARPSVVKCGSEADLYEWRFSRGAARITRTLLLIKEFGLGLAAEEVDRVPNGTVASIEWAIPDAVKPRLVPERRAVLLGVGRSQRAAMLVPLGLPSLPYPSDLGKFEVAADTTMRCERVARLTQRVEGKRLWMPIAICWDRGRNSKPTHWRRLTVTENMKVCRPDVAFAARLSWGTDASLFVYRSLARPALRAALGHQTKARFVVGWFGSDGKVEPIVTIDD